MKRILLKSVISCVLIALLKTTNLHHVFAFVPYFRRLGLNIDVISTQDLLITTSCQFKGFFLIRNALHSVSSVFGGSRCTEKQNGEDLIKQRERGWN